MPFARHRVRPALFAVGLLGLFITMPSWAVGPTFQPDVSFKGSSLTGWHPLGQGAWNARNGEVTGKARDAQKGSWLMLDRSYQDAAFFASFRCGEGCKTGILLRAERLLKA